MAVRIQRHRNGGVAETLRHDAWVYTRLKGYSQEYLAEFVDMGGHVFRREWLRGYTTATNKGAPSQVELDSRVIDVADLSRFITVDLGASIKEHADYTVVAVTGFDGRTSSFLTCLASGSRGPIFSRRSVVCRIHGRFRWCTLNEQVSRSL